MYDIHQRLVTLMTFQLIYCLLLIYCCPFLLVSVYEWNTLSTISATVPFSLQLSSPHILYSRTPFHLHQLKLVVRWILLSYLVVRNNINEAIFLVYY